MKPGGKINGAIVTMSSYVISSTIQKNKEGWESEERFWDPAVRENKIDGR